MNDEYWNRKLKELTGDYGLEFECLPSGDNHIHLTLKYYQKRVKDTNILWFLDVGCGAKKSLRKHIKARWYGIDIMPPEDKNLSDYFQTDCHRLSVGEFDVVFCSHTLEHLLSPLLALSEMFSTLKKEGDLIIGVPYDPHFMGPDHNYILTVKGWIHLVQQAGFTVIDHETVKGCLNLHARKNNG